MKKKLAILGSTGSIGQNTLKVAAHLGMEVVALAAKGSIDLLEEQARAFSPELIAVFDKDKALELAQRLPNSRVVGGMEGLLEAASLPSATHVISALSGTVGILPTAEALRAHKTVLLANKEALVSAGEVMMELASKSGKPLLPVDSEHSALFQCLEGREKKDVHRLLITASGGPFYTWDAKRLKTARLEDALAHPTWTMGPKITVDSSTLMNKGLEIIEAHFLFGIPLKQIEVVVHRESVVHSLVQFVDGSTLAQLSHPHMVYPIQYALTYPKRAPALHPHLDLTQYEKLTFAKADTSRFPCLRLAVEALQAGGSMPSFMNGANDVLVHRFLAKEIGWAEIGKKLEKLMEKHTIVKELNLEKILQVDQEARALAQQG